jgi:acylphosphatase
MAAKRFIVSGRVQGVFYRASTREQAMALGLSGYAKNLDDGRVEVVAIGQPPCIDKLERWLRQGPSGARVDEVQCEDCEELDIVGFRTH